jgi:hypothetical protein
VKPKSREDWVAFPLWIYASERWFKHINLLPLEQQHLLTSLVLKLLLSEDALSTLEDVGILEYEYIRSF